MSLKVPGQCTHGLDYGTGREDGPMRGVARDGCVDPDVLPVAPAAEVPEPEQALGRLSRARTEPTPALDHFGGDDEAEPLPCLDPDVPGAPRTTTQSYRFPPLHSFPPVDHCGREQLIEIAGAPWHEVGAAPAHMQAICALVTRELAPELAAAYRTVHDLQEQVALRDRALAHERACTLSEAGRVVAELERNLQLQSLLARQELELDSHRREALYLRRLIMEIKAAAKP